MQIAWWVHVTSGHADETLRLERVAALRWPRPGLLHDSSAPTQSLTEKLSSSRCVSVAETRSQRIEHGHRNRGVIGEQKTGPQSNRKRVWLMISVSQSVSDQTGSVTIHTF